MPVGNASGMVKVEARVSAKVASLDQSDDSAGFSFGNPLVWERRSRSIMSLFPPSPVKVGKKRRTASSSARSPRSTRRIRSVAVKTLEIEAIEESVRASTGVPAPAEVFPA